MLAVLTAQSLLYLPEHEIASLTPVPPNRYRLVLADGTVGHRPTLPPDRPWAPLGDSWVTPALLTHQGPHWVDPAGYRYPYQPLTTPDPPEPEEHPLPSPIHSLVRQGSACSWHTDQGPEPCPHTFLQALQLYPQLVAIGRSLAVNTRRIRRLQSQAYTAQAILDNGLALPVAYKQRDYLAAALGCDSINQIDADESPLLRELRDAPYDLLSGDPQQVLRDFPSHRSLLLNLLWQARLMHLRGQSHEYGQDIPAFFQHPVQTAARRLGLSIRSLEFGVAWEAAVNREGLVTARSLGFPDPGPERRQLGDQHPGVLLLAPTSAAAPARRLAQKLGVSLFLSNARDRVHLEYLALPLEELNLPSLQLLNWKLPPKRATFLRQDLEQLGLTCATLIAELPAPAASAEAALRQFLTHAPSPPPASPPPSPFSRIPLQGDEGLFFLDPQDIASWSPVPPQRWRVVTRAGQVLYHPGPPPDSPHWVSLPPHRLAPALLQATDQHWRDPAGFTYPLQPLPPASALPQPPAEHPDLPAPAAEIVTLDRHDPGSTWTLMDGRQIDSPRPLEEAADLHPGLHPHNRHVHFNLDRLQASWRGQMQRRLVLDNGRRLSQLTGRPLLRLARRLQLEDPFELFPGSLQHRGLRQLQIRDYPYEIARAPAARLRADFPNPTRLIANLLWQAYCHRLHTGQNLYGDSYANFFYRPLLATLYRAGFLTRLQLRAPIDPTRERLFELLLYILARMVSHYQFFDYRSFGFKDPRPELRILGDRLPGHVLLVEKGDQLAHFGRQLQADFGLSLLQLQGIPAVIDSEYFQHHLFQIYQGDLEVYSFCDYDPMGWSIGPAFVQQMARFGRTCRRLSHLVEASTFTLEEQQLYARPIPIGSPEIASRTAHWLEKTGGVQGQPLGIHANWLFPYSRLKARLEELLPC